MAFKMTSEEWVKELCRLLNESPAYARAAEDWEGDVIFVVEPDEHFSGSACMYLQCHHGKCHGAGKIACPKEREAVLRISAAYGTWRKVVEGRLDPIQGLMMRQLRVEGDVMRLMRFPRAAKEMIDCAKLVPTDFS